MITQDIHSAEVDIDGLLEVFGRNLYSTPVVVIRELIQNSHDACIRRAVESDWNGKQKIFIRCDQNKRTISITDNGSGLTHSEIINYLATVGNGYTRQLRASSDNEDSIGYFGLGFISTFFVSKKVEFFTSSYQTEDIAHRFVTKNGKEFRITIEDSHPVGSTVVLHLREEFSHFADNAIIESLVRKYCCLLPISIYLDDSDQVVNNISVPWRLGADLSPVRRQRLNLDFAEVFDSHFEPLACFPINSKNDQSLRGLLWFQDGSYYSTSDNRIASVFIRSMHITDNAVDLLPNWAGFVGCVIDSKKLVPTASRETIQVDETYNEIKETIKSTLVKALLEIAKENGATWRRLRSRHNDSLLGACLADGLLFDSMHQMLQLPTSSGDLTISEIEKRSADGRITIALEQGGSFEQLIARSMGTPLVYGYRFAVMAFCRELSTRGICNLRTLGGEEGSDLFPVYVLDTEHSTLLEKEFESSAVKIIISHFEPAALPAVKVYDQDALLTKRLNSDDLDKAVGTAALMLARNFTDELSVKQDAFLYLNAANPIIAKFPSYSSSARSNLGTCILAIANLLSNDDAESSEFSDTQSLLSELSESLDKLAKSEM